MNAPAIWIGLPILSAFILYFIRRFSRLVNVLGVIIVVFLALIAWWIPIGTPLQIGNWSNNPLFNISESLTVLGRQFIISNSARSALIIIYLGTAFWFFGAIFIRKSSLFIPAGLVIAGLLTAALSVNPFLYAALFIEIAILVCVPILSPPGTPVSQGTLRFLIFQTLGMIFLVFAAWITDSSNINTINPQVALRTSLILGLGFAMVISVFPFSTWIPIVASETHPYTTGFVFFTLPVVVTLFAFNLYGRYGWLQTSEYTNTAFEMVGLIMIVGGGLWSCFQHNIGRIFGYAIITEIGIFLITFSQILTSIPSDDPANRSIITSLPLTIFFLALLLPRYLNLAIWSFALTIIKEKTKQLDFKSVKGIATEFPIAGISLILASFSLAALPLLAGFPTRLILGIGVGQQSPALGSASLIGYFGLLITTLRMVHTLFHNEKNVPYSLNESRSQTVLLLTGCLVLFVVGIFPQLFLIGLESFSP